jgi:hypothetical protein
VCFLFSAPILLGWFTYHNDPIKTSNLCNDYVIFVFAILFVALSYMTLLVVRRIDELQPRLQSGSAGLNK